MPLADSQKEVGKLQNHLSLLRQQYVKLQAKLSKTEEKYNALLAIHGGEDKSGQNFQLELIKQVGDLYNIEEYRLVNIPCLDHYSYLYPIYLGNKYHSWN